MESHYQWKKASNVDSQAVDKLASETKLSPIIARLLLDRGINTAEDIKKYLNPDGSDLVSPLKLHDMEEAVDRIQDAIGEGQQITVYGDYDADGITSTTLLYETLQGVGANVNYYVPDRFKDGYGPNKDAYKRLIDNGTQLIVTVDNGVTGRDEAEYAKSRNVDVVVTDHHEMPDQLPQAVAIVHPHYPGSEYKYADLSGVGVAFMLAWALTEEFPAEELDLVAIGEIADCVGVTGENRTLIKMGLAQMRQGERVGLHALVKAGGITESQITDTDIGFGIAPRLNALGRVADANDGVRLLTTLDPDEAEKLAQQVETANTRRKDLVAQITTEAEKQAHEPANEKSPTLLLLGHGWHQGVLGIVASRILEETGKTTIVASVNDGEEVAKGSGRSATGYDLFQALSPHRDLMTAFGGHPQACGLSFEPAKVDSLRDVLNQAVDDQNFDASAKPVLDIAESIVPDDINDDLYDQLQRLSPFGPGNETPIFELDDVHPAGIKTMGADGQHLKFDVGGLEVVAFGNGNLAPILSGNGGKINLAVTVGMNEWRGKRNLQLMLKDISIQGTVVVDQRTRKLSPALFGAPGYYLVYEDRLRNNLQGHVPDDLLLTPDEAIETDFSGQALTIVDCPPELNDLDEVLTPGQYPSMMRFLLYEKRSAYLAGMPTRDDFKTLYRFTATHRNVDLRHQFQQLANFLHINAGRLIFMLQLFSDVGFVTINDGVLNPQSVDSAVDLKQEPRYQRYLAKLKAEKQLVFSDLSTLTDWIHQSLSTK